MYNRYIRNDSGTYTRIPQEESQRTPPKKPVMDPPPRKETHPPPPHHEEAKPHCSGTAGRITDGLTGILQHMLDQLHLDHVDTGDLLLLGLLFFLFREDADEELLVALGLLLIL